jgi:hypothetical protein
LFPAEGESAIIGTEHSVIWTLNLRSGAMRSPVILAVLLLAIFGYAQQPKSAATPKLRNECLGKPATTVKSAGHGEVSIVNICTNSISARLCVKYSKTGWSCQLFPGVLPHTAMKEYWSSDTTGEVVDVKAWATDYAAGNDYKNLPTVEEPSKVIMSR